MEVAALQLNQNINPFHPLPGHLLLEIRRTNCAEECQNQRSFPASWSPRFFSTFPPQPLTASAGSCLLSRGRMCSPISSLITRTQHRGSEFRMRPTSGATASGSRGLQLQQKGVPASIRPVSVIQTLIICLRRTTSNHIEITAVGDGSTRSSSYPSLAPCSRSENVTQWTDEPCRRSLVSVSCRDATN